MSEPSVAPVVERARRPGWGPVAAVGAAVVLLDQATKAWALAALDDRTIDLVGSLRLRLVFNTGSAFSIASGGGPVLAVVALAVVVVLVRAGRHVQGGPARVALGMVLGGAIGNLADRAFRAGDGVLDGAVVDFVDLQWWPVFNVADVAISVGAVLLAVSVSRQGEPG